MCVCVCVCKMSFGLTLFSQNYLEDPLDKTWEGSFWLF